MEEVEIQKPQTGRSGRIATVAMAAMILALAVLILFAANRFTLELDLAGDAEEFLEYGNEYREQGAMPVLRGKLFCRQGICPDVTVGIHGQVDHHKLGKYILDYDAAFLWWHGSGSRTVRVVDTQAPVIELVPDPEGAMIHGGVYEEAGYKASDNYDGDITDRVVTTRVGGSMMYAVTDSSGNPAYVERILPPAEAEPPVISLEGGEKISAFVGEYIYDPGYTAVDCFGEDLTDLVETEGEVVWYEPGKYTLTYTVEDYYDNQVSVTREVEIKARPGMPVVRPAGNVIYLTFDDGPGPHTEQLLDVLKQYDVKATFFVVDSGWDEIMQRIVREGHSVGVHSRTHDYYGIYSSPEAFFEDLLGMQQHIYQVTGTKTWLMRFPGGSSNTVSCYNKGIMTLLAQAVEDAGFRYFDWNVDSNDAGGATKAKTVRNNVIDGVSNQRISVVLQHDIHPYSVDAVEDIIIWGKEHGYTFLPLEENSPTTHHGVNN